MLSNAKFISLSLNRDLKLIVRGSLLMARTLQHQYITGKNVESQQIFCNNIYLNC